jgi:DNA-binding response OmpR family regulator
MKNILLVEDAKDYQLLIQQIFSGEAYSMRIADSASSAMTLIEALVPDLVLLDISLPGESGLDFGGRLQENAKTQDIPIIFITGSEQVAQKISAFSLGAEDYITKPFNPLELKARVDAKLTKFKKQQQKLDTLTKGPLHFQLGTQRVFISDINKEVELTTREFKLLYFLARNEDQVMTREKILIEVWGASSHVVDRTIDTHIYQLRKKLGEYADHIEAVQGSGYRFTPLRRKAKLVS